MTVEENSRSPDSDSEPADDLRASDLGTQTYWESIYQRDTTNFSSFGDIGEIWFGEACGRRMVRWILDHFRQDKNLRILDVGCGNAHLLFDLAEKGYRHLTGVDYAPSAIALAQSIASEKEIMDSELLLKCVDMVRMDPCDLRRELGQFDVVLDKGTLDAISLCPQGELERPLMNTESSRMTDARQKTSGDGTVAEVSKEWISLKRDESAVKRYVDNLRALVRPNAVLIITSCNWTEVELGRLVSEHFEITERIANPSFSFGGQKGQTVTTLVLRPLEVVSQ